MVRYSNDVNVYVESRSPMHEKKLPVVAKAAGVYRHPSVARNLENPNVRTITETSLNDDYNEALRLLEENIIHVYQILGAKGGLTESEWKLMKSSISKGLYRFPDINQSLGTAMRWQIDDKLVESFLKTVLKKHGIDVKLVSSSGDVLLYEDENAFLKKMASDFSVNMNFEQIEKKIDSADYSGTKKRLHYITIYDFLKFHLDLKDVPSKEELIRNLDTCKDKASANIIAVKDLIVNISGNFWVEYEKYREFKMVQVLARWYGKSTVRCLNGAAYEYFSENISEQILSKAMSYLKVHTAFINPKKSKADTSGSNAVFEFQIEKLSGDIYATVNEGNYATEFTHASRKLKLTSSTSLQLQNLDYGKTYCVSLWEVMGSDDAVKLGDLPRVTPGIKWPTCKKISKSPVNDTFNFSVDIEGGEGNLSYVACVQKGNTIITTPNSGMKLKPNIESGKLSFSVKTLEYDENYTFCVFVLLDEGKYCDKLVADFNYIPKKVQLEKVIRKAGNKYISGKEIYLDFVNKRWPELFDSGTIRFACRTDRFPDNPDDGQPGFIINSVSENAYREGTFKLITPKDTFYPVLYICGWLNRGTEDNQLVVQNVIYDLLYKLKGDVLHFDIFPNTQILNLSLPSLRIYGFDKKDNIVFSGENIIVGADLQCQLSSAGKIKMLVVETADLSERQIYQFRSRKTFSTGKTKV